jgi:hypothetical protein
VTDARNTAFNMRVAGMAAQEADRDTSNKDAAKSMKELLKKGEGKGANLVTFHAFCCACHCLHI